MSKEEFVKTLTVKLLVYGVVSGIDAEDVVSEIDSFVDGIDDNELTMDDFERTYKKIRDKFSKQNG